MTLARRRASRFHRDGKSHAAVGDLRRGRRYSRWDPRHTAACCLPWKTTQVNLATHFVLLSRGQHTELVVIGIGQHLPFHVTLADLDATCS